MRRFLKGVFLALVILLISATVQGADATMRKETVNLPQTVGAWTKPATAQIVDKSNIFNYMDGAGEMYLAYRFDHLEVYEYTAEKQDAILVEVYFMETPADAFGLLSLDWGGEPVTLGAVAAAKPAATVVPPARALYGQGLLRLWADTIYARVMAPRETPEAKAAILAIGQALAAGRAAPPEPGLLQALPPAIAETWQLRPDRVGYLRSYLVFNSLYYLSHKNILNFDLTTEAVTAPYEKRATTGGEPQRVQVLFIKYATPAAAQKALNSFHTAYLPEQPQGDVATPATQAFKIEDGWVGYRLDNTCLAIAFECPDQESAQLFMAQMPCRPF
jgi:hypothetical protein